MTRFAKAAAGVVGFNMAVAAVLFLIAAWYWEGRSWHWLREAILYNVVFSNCIGTVAVLTLPRLAPPLWKHPPVTRWALLVAVLLCINLVGCLAAVAVLKALGEPHPFWPFLLVAYRRCVVITLLIGILGVLFESWRHRVERANLELKNRQIEHERALKLSREAQLASIESRIQPHFLFNALNSVSSLIRQDPEQAERMIERLARLLRSSLDVRASLVPLREEIRLVRDYLEIQAARFATRLRYHIEVPDSLADALVPPFSVQTLVENSIKYAVAPRREGGEIRVSAHASGGRMVVMVADDGPGFDAGAMAPGHGLDILHARLLTMFGTEAALDIRPGGPGASVSFVLPQTAHESLPG